MSPAPCHTLLPVMLPELLDYVFPHLLHHRPLTGHRDGRFVKTDLLSCSLVCRQWRDLTRRHIFHTTTFVFDRVRTGTSETLGTSEPGNERPSLQQFWTFLGESPQLCRLIRRLNLIVKYVGVPGDQVCVERHIIYQILSLLPSLRYFMIEGFGIDASNLHPPTDRLRYIPTLDVRAPAPALLYCSPLAGITAAVHLFAEIGTLRLGTHTRMASPHDRAPAQPSTRVKSLDLVDWWPPNILQCFDTQALRMLVVPAGTRTSAEVRARESWPQALSSEGLDRQLRELSFQLTTGDEQDLRPCISILEHCPTLQRVGFTFPDRAPGLHIYTFYISNAMLWTFVSDIIRSMPYHVPELVLEFGRPPDGMRVFSGVRDTITQGVESALEDRYEGKYPIVRVRNSDGSVPAYEIQRQTRARLSGLSAADVISF